MPDDLTWFKWEAYVTWISGFFLLVVLYYRGADLFLIDQAVMELSQWRRWRSASCRWSLGWVAYDRLCKSPIGNNDTGWPVRGAV